MDHQKSPIETNGGSFVTGSVTTGRDFIGRDKITHGDEIHGNKIIVTQSPEEVLSTFLAEAVAKFEADTWANLHHQPLAKPPYKFLYAYDVQDADIFFGRTAATQTLHQIVSKDRITILHAKSGAGKTSLLNTGLTPRLIQERRFPVYARAYQDPLLAIKQSIAPGTKSWPALLPQLSLHEFLGHVYARLSRPIQELVIILDQFEEFFIFQPERTLRQAFITDLAQVYRDKQLPVRFIIAIRKDYYSDLAEFQRYIPSIFYNEYRLDTLSRPEAEQAINAPVQRQVPPIAYAPPLLNMLLNDLDQSAIELPHLQIICTQLYDGARAAIQESIEVTQYEQLGRPAGILTGYLNKVLATLPGQGEIIAKAIFVELVSSEATKRVVSLNTLAARIQAAPEKFDQVIIQLEQARLLKRDENEGIPVYELAHEYLINQVTQWTTTQDVALKQVQELLEREVTNWRLHGVLIPQDRLELIYVQREYLRVLSEESWGCILFSSLYSNSHIEDWIKLITKFNEQLVFKALTAIPKQAHRNSILRSLGKIWMLPNISLLGAEESIERTKAVRYLGQRIVDVARLIPLIVVMLKDENITVRREAAEVLGQLVDPEAFELLIARLKDDDRFVRHKTVMALEKFGKTAVCPVISALKDDDAFVRRKAAEVLGQLGDPEALEPLIATLKDDDQFVRTKVREALQRFGFSQTKIRSLSTSFTNIEQKKPLPAPQTNVELTVPVKVVKASAQMSESQIVDLLITNLKDQRPFVRQKAAKTLGALGITNAVASLITILEEDYWAVRQAAIVALGQIRDPQAVVPLIVALKDVSSIIRWLAAEALGEIRDERALDPLLAALEDPVVHVRLYVIESLGKFGNARSIHGVIAALNDPSENVRHKAADVLNKLEGTIVPPLVLVLNEQNDEALRLRIIKLLGQTRDARAVEPLVAELNSPQSIVRREAVKALGRLGNDEAIEPLVTSLKDQHESVRRAAVMALGQLGHQSAIVPLTNTLNDSAPSVAQEVAEAIHKIDCSKEKPPSNAANTWPTPTISGGITDKAELPSCQLELNLEHSADQDEVRLVSIQEKQ